MGDQALWEDRCEAVEQRRELGSAEVVDLLCSLRPGEEAAGEAAVWVVGDDVVGAQYVGLGCVDAEAK